MSLCEVVAQLDNALRFFVGTGRGTFVSMRDIGSWTPPAHWSRITTLDMHTGGEPLRVVTGGLPPIQGKTTLEKRRFFREHLDHLRTGLMWEPRGHADMYGAIVTSAHDDADFDVFFLHNEGYSTMCGHAVIALTKLFAEMGEGRAVGDARALTLNVPAGRIDAHAEMRGATAVRSSFRNVPSFVLLRDKAVDVPGFGRVIVDVAYGGAFYALVDADTLGLPLTPDRVNDHIACGRAIKRAVRREFEIAHPFEKDLSFLYGTIFTGAPQDDANHSRNVCIFAEGEVDRSATGSGVSARAALHHARGELAVGKPITIESVIGSTMTVTAVEQVTYGPYEAVIPEVSGTASIIGKTEFYFDPEDPLKNGFIIR
jgi:proline racemase